MCNQLAVKARHAAQTDKWAVLRTKDDEVPAVEAFLKERLMTLAEREAEHYNDNGPLGDAIQEAVALADILDRWPQELHTLSEAVGATAEALLTSPEPVSLPKKEELTLPMAEGLCALIWARPTLEISLDGCKVMPECLTVLARALRPTVKSLSLEKCDIAKGGGNLLGVQHLCRALQDERRCGLQTICLDGNELKDDAGKMLAEGLKENNSITSLRWGGQGG